MSRTAGATGCRRRAPPISNWTTRSARTTIWTGDDRPGPDPASITAAARGGLTRHRARGPVRTVSRNRRTPPAWQSPPGRPCSATAATTGATGPTDRPTKPALPPSGGVQEPAEPRARQSAGRRCPARTSRPAGPYFSASQATAATTSTATTTPTIRPIRGPAGAGAWRLVPWGVSSTNARNIWVLPAGS